VDHIEFDIRSMKEIVPKKNRDITSQISFARDDYLPILACGLADPELIQPCNFNLGLAANPEKPQTLGPSSAQAQPCRRRAQDKAPLCPGVEQDADLLTIDRAIDDQLVMLQANGPLRESL
jgi:hypothetical protein